MTSIRALLIAAVLTAPVAVFAEDEGKDEGDTPELPFELQTPDAAPAPEAPAAAEAPALDEAAVPVVTPADEAVRLLSQALDRIAALQILIASGEQGVDRDKAQAELDEARRALQSALLEVGKLQQDTELRAWLRSEGLLVEADAAHASAAPGGAEDEPAGLAPDRFRALITAIDGVSFTEGKMDVLTRELAEATVTSDQASRLVELFSFSRDRVDALVFLHPRIVDPENFDSLLSALKFESDRETVRNQLGLDG